MYLINSSLALKLLDFFSHQFGLQGEQGFYLVGRNLSGILRQNFQKLIGEATATPQEVEVVMGRTLHVCANFYIEETRRAHDYYYYQF